MILNEILYFRKLRQSNPPTLEDLKLTVVKRRKKEQNQVATSIADLAQSLDNHKRVPVHIRWQNEYDQGYAQSWPPNVTHSGFPKTRNAERQNKPFGLEKLQEAAVV